MPEEIDHVTEAARCETTAEDRLADATQATGTDPAEASRLTDEAGVWAQLAVSHRLAAQTEAQGKGAVS